MITSNSITRSAQIGMPITLGGRKFRVDQIYEQNLQEGWADVSLVSTDSHYQQHYRTRITQAVIAATAGSDCE